MSGASEGANSRAIAAVERAADVLLYFTKLPSSTLGVTEISQGLGLSKAATHRILASLRSRDLVYLDEATRRYSLGPATVSLGKAFLDKQNVHQIALPELNRLSATTGETATLSIRTGDHRIYLDQAVPNQESRVEVAVGQPFPLHAGSSSKVFLAHLPQPEIDDYLARVELTAITGNTITDPDVLRQDLSQIADRGYAISFSERRAGTGSVAAPVFGHDGRVAASISVSGPVDRFGDEVESCIEALLECTERVSHRLGYQR